MEEKLRELRRDEGFLAKARSCSSAEELHTLLAENGADLPLPELQKAFAMWEEMEKTGGEPELSEEALEGVAGGCALLDVVLALITTCFSLGFDKGRRDAEKSSQ